MKKSKISIIGLGYVGLPILATISKKTHLYGHDINTKLIYNLKKKKFDISEPGLSKILERSINKNKIKFTNQLLKSDIYYVAVPTPILKNLKVDLSHIYSAIDEIANLLEDNNLIIITSTVPVGTTKKLYNYLRKKTKNKIHFYMSFTPETILPGKALYELENNSKIIGGINEKSSVVTEKFINRYVAKNTFITDHKTAETVKLAQNSYRDLNIAFANELAFFAMNNKINKHELIQLSNKHPRVNIHNASIGVGGHCIPVDPYFLINENNNYFSLIKRSRKINEKQPQVIIDEIKGNIISNNVKTLCFFGLTYKENIDDFRNSPALKIVDKIHQLLPKIKISLVDPFMKKYKEMKIDLRIMNHDKIVTISKNDLIVFLVGHDIFQDIYSELKINHSNIINFTNTLNDN